MKESQKNIADLTQLAGKSSDPTVKSLLKKGFPPTLENYLQVNYAEGIPEEIGAEHLVAITRFLLLNLQTKDLYRPPRLRTILED